jgi:hypothetical protein
MSVTHCCVPAFLAYTHKRMASAAAFMARTNKQQDNINTEQIQILGPTPYSGMAYTVHTCRETHFRDIGLKCS